MRDFDRPVFDTPLLLYLLYFSHDDYIVSIPPCNGQYNGFR